MVVKLKNILYFPIASYFSFFAKIRLIIWNPLVIVVTGSSGKTTLLHMLEAQLGSSAKYSYHANSSYGIPFDLLNLHRSKFSFTEWIRFAIKAPLMVFMKTFEHRIYVVEADCDRPGEGKFLAKLLNPNIVLWLNSANTHSMNFDKLGDKGSDNKYDKSYVDELIAYEFGYFLEYCRQLVLVNGDIPHQMKQVKRLSKSTRVRVINKDSLKNYKVSTDGTVFIMDKINYKFKALLPEEAFYSAKMTEGLLLYLNKSFDPEFASFNLPPGRSTVLRGKNGITIIDSSYNANLSSMKTILLMFDKLPGKEKWLVLGDMLELGKSEKSDHIKLAELILNMKVSKVILVGELLSKYTYPLLVENIDTLKFDNAGLVLDFIENNQMHDNLVLFKGSQSIKLEGIIEKLLLNKSDIMKLPRRGEFWDNWRKSSGITTYN